MAYKHTFNRDYNYLVHFNKNHDPKNGRFTFGDGDGIPNNKNRKYQNDDGSLTEEGQKKFGKLMTLKKESEDHHRKALEATKEENAYMKKHGYTTDDSEDYKKDLRTAYALDPDLREISDRAEIENQKAQEAGKKFLEEYMQVAYSKYDFFTKVGVDRVDEILKNYNQYYLAPKQEKEKLLKDNGYEKDGWGNFVWYKKNVKGADIMIDSADEIKYGNAVAKSIESHKSKLDKEKDRILTEEPGFPELDREQKGKFKLQTVSVYGDSDTAEANYWYDGPGDPIGGHEINIEFDIKTGKPIGYSVNG